MMSLCAFAVIVFAAKILLGESYNFDAEFPEIISSNHENDHFGFSVFLQKGTPSILIASAVKRNSTNFPYYGSPGVVYKCVLNGSKAYSELDFDQKATAYQLQFKIDNELLGATIDGGEFVDDPVVACAPRLIRRQPMGYLANGGCFFIKNSSFPIEPFIPLSDKGSQVFMNKYFYGYGEAGMSLNYIKEYSEILIGAPGVLGSKGTLIRYQIMEPFQPQLELSTQIKKLSIPNPHYFNPELEYDSYLGYSSSYGVFHEGKGLWYVAGAPRASLLKGKVFVFSYPDTNEESIIFHREFVGEQIGAYFGFSLLAFKNSENTKNVSDLIIGAPMFSLKDYEEGCVYYYRNNGQGDFQPPVTLFGDVSSGSRFGYAISNLGDINHDSHNDIAISAPYESNGGAVYIFLGRHFGFSNKFSQKIRGSAIDDNVLGLGFSLSRGLDIDQNSFNDLAIGDSKSGKVIIFRTKPVIKYFPTLTSDVMELTVAPNIQFNLRFCLSYESPDGVVKSVETVLHYYPDSRILMTNQVDQTITLKLDDFYCENFNINLTNAISSFTAPLSFKINYEIKNQSRSDFCKTCPMTDPTETNSISVEFPFVNGCKSANLCLTDLKVLAYFYPNVSFLVVGKDIFLTIKVVVTNFGEPAYLCKLTLLIPEGLDIRRIPNRCTLNENELDCTLKDVLFKNYSTEIQLEFDLTRLTHQHRQKHVDFFLEVKSSGNDTNEDDNRINLGLPLETEFFVQINGESQPDQLMYKDRINFSHKYSFVNLGPSPLQTLNFVIDLPFKIKNEKEAFISKHSIRSPIDGVEGECYDYDQNNYLTEYERESDLFYIFAQNISQNVSQSVDKTIVNLPLDQIFFVNCTVRGLITCKKLICSVNQVIKKDQVVRVDFLLEISPDKIRMQSDFKKIILFQSDVSVKFNQKFNKTSSIKTVLIGHISSTEVSYWIYILGVVIGVVLLSGIVFVLYKLKFFHRPLMERLVNSEEITSVIGDDSLETEDE